MIIKALSPHYRNQARLDFGFSETKIDFYGLDTASLGSPQASSDKIDTILGGGANLI